jgi:hypothetical protein
LARILKKLEKWHIPSRRENDPGTWAIAFKCQCGAMIDYWYMPDAGKRVLRHWHPDGMELVKVLEQTKGQVLEALGSGKPVVNSWLKRVHDGT